MYSLKYYHDNPYAWIFTESARKDISTLSLGGGERKTDKVFSCVYRHNYYIEIWEIKALAGVDLKKIRITQGLHLANVNVQTGQILDSHSFREKDNYRGFYGTVKKMAFENSDWDYLAFIEYRYKIEPTLFLMYKANNNFYMIIINASVPFDESIINILDLK
jgi:hypothetical protein